MPPKISVVMPVWNGEGYLPAAIASVLAQTFSDFEFIIIDDGSTDRTAEILASYSDPRIKVHRLEHAGIVVALNFGVSIAQADWIARQDADDISRNDRFSTQLAAVERRPESVLCFSAVSLIGEGSEKIRQPRLPRTKALLALRLCYQCPIVHSSVLFRKDIFLRAGSYRVEERHAEDYALWGRMLELGTFVGNRQPLLQLRVHSQSVSKANLGKQLALSEEIAVEHCRRFMKLTNEEATRASGVLSAPVGTRRWRDWVWFITRCAPRLRWKSNEMHAWLFFQTVKRIYRC